MADRSYLKTCCFRAFVKASAAKLKIVNTIQLGLAHVKCRIVQNVCTQELWGGNIHTKKEKCPRTKLKWGRQSILISFLASWRQKATQKRLLQQRACVPGCLKKSHMPFRHVSFGSDFCAIFRGSNHSSRNKMAEIQFYLERDEENATFFLERKPHWDYPRQLWEKESHY